MDTRYLKLLLPIILALLFLGALVPVVKTSGENEPASLIFSEVTDAAGLYYRGETWTWSWGDFDDDGFIDLFIANHPELNVIDVEEPSYLMHNDGGAGFTDVITASGIYTYEDRHDVPWIDYDNDGDLDVFISIGGRGGSGVPGPNQLFRQEADGSFTEVAVTAGVDYPLGRGRGTVFLDYDLDHDLDFFFTSAPNPDTGGLNALFGNNGDGTFTIVEQTGIYTSSGSHTNAAVGDYDNDGDPDIYVTDRTALYRNDAGTYTAVHATAGVSSTAVQGADWGDYDNDGDLDLYVTRGKTDLKTDFWYQPEDDIVFAGRAEADEDGLEITVNGEGNLRFYLQRRAGGSITHEPDVIYLGASGQNPATNPFTMMYGDTSGPPAYTPGVSNGFYIWQSPAGSYHVHWSGPEGSFYRFAGTISTNTSFNTITEVGFEKIEFKEYPNHLFQNLGDGTFIDVAPAAGVDDVNDCRGLDWGDYDNDGDLDLFVQKKGYIDANFPNLLYRNNGDGTFTDVAEAAGLAGVRLGPGWGALWADYDNDGFLDLLTNQATWMWPFPTGSYELFHNGGNGNNWLMVDLRGVTSNSRGYGTRLWATVNGITQYREYNDSSHHFTHYSGPVHFGLGQAGKVDVLRIQWASGQVDEHYNIPANFRVTATEGEGPLTWNWSYLPMLLYGP